MFDSSLATLSPALFARPLDPAQALRLAQLSGLEGNELAGRPLASLHPRLSGTFHPELLGLRRVEGRVVRKNPATGALEPISGATVHVDDTVGSFLVYSPPEWPDWSWFLPFRLHRKEISAATTDGQGHFSVGVPRWEIEAIASWRQGRIRCADFSRPRLCDLVRDLDPGYLSEPAAITIRKPGFLLGCQKRLGRPLADRIAALIPAASAFDEGALESLLETRVAPERPAALDEIGAPELRGLLAVLAREHGLSPEVVEGAKLGPWIGPFWRGGQLMLKLWTPLVGAPDLTFRVTRGFGESGRGGSFSPEGFFSVPWNRGALPQLTLTVPAKIPAPCLDLRSAGRAAPPRRPKLRFAAALPALAA